MRNTGKEQKLADKITAENFNTLMEKESLNVSQQDRNKDTNMKTNMAQQKQHAYTAQIFNLPFRSQIYGICTICATKIKHLKSVKSKTIKQKQRNMSA